MIGIIDYGMGNIFSVRKALERMEIPYFVSGIREDLIEADGYILPGVGAFKDAMQNLHADSLADFIKAEAAKGKPILGICLGMQLLFDESEENGRTKGLGLLKGKVGKLPTKIPDGRQKVPHMGWNDLTIQNESFLINGLDGQHAYFVHSFYVRADRPKTVLASTNYGVEVPAVVGSGNVYGTQFHPEKSSTAGLAILKRFAEKVKEGANA
ncbi:imidazole glycerol phosphate synthase subunit HisH [Bacillus sp. SJS]|uniref:imidazole glycerol phosphate synthase subunit HisH n=1 Tax=Bacillus sp. SJS TaxID=1423321 RepID=UPI0004DD5A73|nr:imidazole glycerol phosphate synthase subunit HisH [Bacillus sp. SJS]KZZ84885.1 imidazole glycerol phosphate synthase, glutamine amidotransferase subunit [Bacillus sp. SJS]